MTITADWVRERLREDGWRYSAEAIGPDMMASLLKVINTALNDEIIRQDGSLAMVPGSVCKERVALAVAVAYEDASQWCENEDKTGDPDDLYTGRKHRVVAIRRRTPADAQAALAAHDQQIRDEMQEQADREREEWQKATGSTFPSQAQTRLENCITKAQASAALEAERERILE